MVFLSRRSRRVGGDPTASGLAGINRLTAGSIRAGVPVDVVSSSVPNAEAKPATVLQESVKMTRADGGRVIPDDEVWGIFDQSMTRVDMRKLKMDFSPNKQDLANMWLDIVSHTGRDDEA